MSDDYSNDIFTSGVYVVGGEPFVGRIETLADSDWFRISGIERYYDYLFSVGGPGGGDYPIDTLLRLRNLQGQPFRDIVYFSSQSKHHKHLSSSEIYVDLSTRDSFGIGYEFSAVPIDVGSNTFEDARLFDLLDSAYLGAAIETTGDRDFLRYNLYAGIEYTIDLLGISSESTRDTTLTAPKLTLLSHLNEVIDSDVGSGEGSNSRIVYTPESTGIHIFEISSESGGTGSYVLESNQFDDHLPGTKAETVLDLLSEEEATFEFARNYGSDRDSFEVKFLPGANYRLSRTSSLQRGDFTIYDGSGTVVDTFTANTGFFNPLITGHQTENLDGLYIETSNFTSGVNRFSIRLEDDHQSFNRQPLQQLNDEEEGVIERVGDRDWFSFYPAKYGRYQFSLDGEPELLLSLAAHLTQSNYEDPENEFLNSGPNPLYVDTNEIEELDVSLPKFIVGVRSNARKLGTYTLSAELINAGEGEQTTAIVDMSTGAGRIRNVVTKEHESWHRFEVKKNTWYEINSPDIEFRIATAGSTNTQPFSSGVRRYFTGENDNPRFLVTGLDEEGGRSEQSYEIRIVESAKRSLQSRHWLSPGTANIGFQTEINRVTDVEVYATRPYEYVSNGQTISVSANTYQTMSGSDFLGEIFAPNNLQFDESVSGNTDVFVRQAIGNGWTEWASIEAYHRAPASDVGDISALLPQNLSFAFAESLPDYLDGDTRFSGFASLDQNERDVFDEVFQRWTQASNQRFSELGPSAQAESADIVIFKSAIDSDTLAFPLEGSGANSIDGDIVLNTNSPLWDDFSRGKQGRFELLRAIGTTLGLNETDTVGRNKSVMGFRTGESVDGLPFPSSPMPADSYPFFSAGRLNTHDPDDGATLYRLNGDDPFYETVYEGPLLPTTTTLETRDAITVGGSALDAKIDLRPGGISFVSDGSSQPYTWAMSEFSFVADAYGGIGNDSIRGNAMENLLVGQDGNDILIGGVGDDLLLGQAGDDYYSYKIGHGGDVISEQGFGGNDTLRIEGLKNFNDLAEDLSFRRLGNGLGIRLDLDNEINKNASTITLHNFGQTGFEIESLVIVREGQFLNRVSLMSVFEQSDNSWRRFDLASGSDSNGILVTPIT